MKVIETEEELLAAAYAGFWLLILAAAALIIFCRSGFENGPLHKAREHAGVLGLPHTDCVYKSPRVVCTIASDDRSIITYWDCAGETCLPTLPW
jgi:hypothetical protein